MKFCPYCKQWNHGKPMRCRYCARTWNVKLCPGGHVNPVTANFCGECGRANLSEPAGRNSIIGWIFQSLKYLFYLWLIYVGLMIIYEISQSEVHGDHITLLLAIVILILGLNFALGHLKVTIGLNWRTILRSIGKFVKWAFNIGDR